MLRLNQFTQDDSHTIIFNEVLEIEKIIIFFINNVRKIYNLFSITIIKFRLSTVKKEDYIGTEEQRNKVQNIMREILIKNKVKFYEEYDGAFYGPKLDVIIEDSLSREWQTGTLQLDTCIMTNMNFKIQNNNNNKKEYIVIHQAILGTIERFIGIILEHVQRIPEIINPYKLAIVFISQTEQIIQNISEKVLHNIKINTNCVDFFKCRNLNEKIGKIKKLQYQYYMIIGDKEIKLQEFELINNMNYEVTKHSFEDKLNI